MEGGRALLKSQPASHPIDLFPPRLSQSPHQPRQIVLFAAQQRQSERRKVGRRRKGRPESTRKRKNTSSSSSPVSPTLHHTGRTAFRLEDCLSTVPRLLPPVPFFSGKRGKGKKSHNVVGRLCIGHLRAPPQLQHGHRKGRGHLLPRPQPHLFRQVHLQEEFGAGEVSGRQREPRLRRSARKGLCPRLLQATGESGGVCSLPREDTLRDPGWGCPDHGNRRGSRDAMGGERGTALPRAGSSHRDCFRFC